MQTTRLPIDIPAAPTSLVVGRGAIGALGAVLEAESIALRGRRVLVVSDANVAETHGLRAARALGAACGDAALVAHIALSATEPEKAMPAVERVWSAALAAKLTRTDLVVAVGGGLVGDLAGFAAATYLRGVDFVQVPTTLLAMVDAAIGGKTGINLALPGGGLGKNLAGAFWQPRTTVADPETLATLPTRELRAGLAECAKHAILAGEAHFAELEREADALATGDADALARLILRSAAVKIGIVVADPFERGVRATLNLGHTFGHAIETLPGQELLHGEAVAIGLVAAAAAAHACPALGGGAREDLRARTESLLARLGLPTRLLGEVDRDEIRRRMGFDKKNEGGALRLILPRRLGEVVVVRDAPATAVEAGLDAILAPAMPR
jgi:3-dehydroquinate synthase